jgi:hypothetical protein
MKKRTILFIFIGIVLVLIAAFPRAIEVCNGNFLFGFDQGKHWLAAKSIVIDYFFPLIGDEVGGGGGFFQGPGWYYLLAIPFFLFQGDPYGQLFLMFCIGLCTVFFSYYIFSLRFGRIAGFCISFLIAISPAIAIQSRFAWPPFVIPLITVFYIDALYGVFQGNRRSWFLLFFLLGLMTHFEIAIAATLGVATCIMLLITKQIRLRFLKMSIIGALIPLFPMMIFDLRHQFLNLKGIWRMLTTTSTESQQIPLSKLFYDHIPVFYENLFGAFPYFSYRMLLPILCAIVLAIIVFDKKLKKDYKLFLICLFSIPCLIYLIFLFYKSMLWGWWLLELPIIYIVFVGLLSSYLFKRNIIGKIFIILFFAILVRSTIPDILQTWKKDYNDFGGTQKIKGRTEAVETIYQDAGGAPFGVLVFTPPVYTYPYDYLFWWIGTKKYNYVPYKEKRGMFYLLIEPDAEKPWSYKGWLETVVKDGTVIFSRELPSGFILEKRMAQ